MDRLQAMSVFVAVAEQGGFAAAGRALSLTPPVVTRAITGLEDRLGVQLLVRTTRQVRLTEAGERYLEDCRRILADLTEAEAAAAGAHDAPQGQVVVSAPQMFGCFHVAPILLAFLDRYPEVRARLLFLDRVVNMMEEGVDVAVRLGNLPDSGLRAVRVGSVRRLVVATPAYLERSGTPETPEDLAAHRVIAVSSSTQAPVKEWRLGADESLRAPITPWLQTTTNDSAVQIALSGAGLARLMSYQVAEPLAEGRLTPVLTRYEPAPAPIHVLHTHGVRPPAKVRLLVDHLVDALRANPAVD